MVPFSIQGLVSHARFPVLYNSLEVLKLAESCLRDWLTLMKLHRVLTNEQAEAEFIAAVVLRF